MRTVDVMSPSIGVPLSRVLCASSRSISFGAEVLIVGDWVARTAVADSRVALHAGQIERSNEIHIAVSLQLPNHTLERTAARSCVFASEFRLGMARASADRGFGGCRSVLIR